MTNRAENSLYIALDSGECVGKTTLSNNLYNHLKQNNNICQIKEPGFTPAGAILRKYVLGEERSLEEQTEIMMADRILTQELVVKPTLKKVGILLSDRSVISNLVYQGLMHSQESFDKILKKHNDLNDFIWPDIVIVGQCPIEVIISRLENRKKDKGAEHNYLDGKAIDFHLKLHHHFSKVHEWCPVPVAYVDFNQPVDAIRHDVVNWIYKKIPNLNSFTLY